MSALRFPQQDSLDAPLPALVVLLDELQTLDCSVYWRRSDNELTVSPIPPAHVRREIESNYQEIQTLLPGVCDGCGLWVIRRLETYFLDNPHLCPKCVDYAVSAVNRSETWDLKAIPDRL